MERTLCSHNLHLDFGIKAVRLTVRTIYHEREAKINICHGAHSGILKWKWWYAWYLKMTVKKIGDIFIGERTPLNVEGMFFYTCMKYLVHTRKYN